MEAIELAAPVDTDQRLIAALAARMAGNFTVGSIKSLLGAGADIAGEAVAALLHMDGVRKLLRIRPVILAPAPVRAMHRQNLIRQAAYLVNAARRITAEAKLDRPSPQPRGPLLNQALVKEAAYFRQHVDAVANRTQAAQQVATMAKMQGKAGLLGWYSRNDSRTSAECLAAHGRNFDPNQIPAIGYPGAVHPHCRCKPGPAHQTNLMVGSPVAKANQEEVAASMVEGRQRAKFVLDLADVRAPHRYRHGWIPINPGGTPSHQKTTAEQELAVTHALHNSPNLSMAAEGQMRRDWGESVSGAEFTSAEQHAMKVWGTGFMGETDSSPEVYRVINARLRGDTSQFSLNSIRAHEAELDAVHRDLQSALSKSKLTKPTTVYRGLVGQTKGWKVGDVVTDPGYQSTSFDPRVAHLFRRDRRDSALIQIDLPAGHPALKLEGNPLYDEAEITLGPGVPLRVTRIESGRIWMEAVQ